MLALKSKHGLDLIEKMKHGFIMTSFFIQIHEALIQIIML